MPFPADWYEVNRPDHYWFRWRFRAAMALVRRHGMDTTAPLRVLEVGCGTGVLRAQFEGETGWTVDGADLNLAALERAPQGRGELYYYDAMEQHPTLLGAYDVVILFDVLEHIDAPIPFLRACTQHLKDAGLLLVNVPALPSAHGSYDRAVGHLRRYTKQALRDELRAARLEPVRLRYWGLSLIPLAFARKLLLAGRQEHPDVVRRGMNPPFPWMASVLSAVARIETSLFESPPIGTSLLAVGRRSS